MKEHKSISRSLSIHKGDSGDSNRDRVIGRMFFIEQIIKSSREHLAIFLDRDKNPAGIEIIGDPRTTEELSNLVPEWEPFIRPVVLERRGARLAGISKTIWRHMKDKYSDTRKAADRLYEELGLEASAFEEEPQLLIVKVVSGERDMSEDESKEKEFLEACKQLDRKIRDFTDEVAEVKESLKEALEKCS